jgi:hypothetical protein
MPTFCGLLRLFFFFFFFLRAQPVYGRLIDHYDASVNTPLAWNIHVLLLAFLSFPSFQSQVL